MLHFSVSKKLIVFQKNAKILSGTICSRPKNHAKTENKALEKLKQFKD